LDFPQGKRKRPSALGKEGKGGEIDQRGGEGKLLNQLEKGKGKGGVPFLPPICRGRGKETGERVKREGGRF